MRIIRTYIKQTLCNGKNFSIAKSPLVLEVNYKNLFSILVIGFIVLLLPATSFSQNDTTGTAAKTDSIIQYLTPLEYAFMMHEETKFMLRFPAVGVGAEVQVLPYFTIMAQSQFLEVYSNYNYREFDYGINFMSEARWYYGSKKKGVQNMSGNYLSLGYGYQNDFNSNYANRYYTRWGVQRRFLGSGLIDLGVNIGYAEDKGRSLLGNKSVFIQTTGTIGLGIVFNNEKALDKDRLCPAIKCYEGETFMLKFNTLNLLEYNIFDPSRRSVIFLKPQVGVEQKLFNSPFSIGANLKLDMVNVFRHFNEVFKSPLFELAGRVNARYYYNLKNRIISGKSGNGFSANYVSGGVYRIYNSWNLDRPLNSERQLYLYNEALTLTTGVQRTFSKHLYFDVELGLAYGTRGEGIHKTALFGDMQVGIKF